MYKFVNRVIKGLIIITLIYYGLDLWEVISEETLQAYWIGTKFLEYKAQCMEAIGLFDFIMVIISLYYSNIAIKQENSVNIFCKDCTYVSEMSFAFSTDEFAEYLKIDGEHGEQAKVYATNLNINKSYLGKIFGFGLSLDNVVNDFKINKLEISIDSDNECFIANNYQAVSCHTVCPGENLYFLFGLPERFSGTSKYDNLNISVLIKCTIKTKLTREKQYFQLTFDKDIEQGYYKKADILPLTFVRYKLKKIKKFLGKCPDRETIFK